jgi:PAS domain S-box-containing protein
MRLRLQGRYAITILALTGSIILVLSGGLFVQSRNIMQEMRQSSDRLVKSALLSQIRKQGEGMVRHLAENLVNPTYNADMDQIFQLLSSAAAQRGVRYVYLFDVSGQVLHDGTEMLDSYGRKLDRRLTGGVLESREVHVHVHGNELHVTSPIVVGSQLLGGVVMGLSLEQAQADIAALQDTLAAIGDKGTANYILATAGLAGLLIALAVVLSIAVARGQTRPINVLAGLTKRIGERDYDIAVPFERQDEIGELGLALKDMARDLKRTTVSRDYFDNILRSMLDPLLVARRSGKIEMANEPACRLLGYDLAELMDRSVHDILRRRAAESESFDFRAIEADRFISSDEAVLVRRDGTELPVLVSCSVLVGRSGNGDRFVCVARDIADRLAMENALRAAKRRAETANRAKSEFLANMSHELRTPLNAILGFADLMAVELLGPLGHDSYRGYVLDIRHSGRHLLNVISELLDTAKVDAGRMKLEESVVDVPATVDGVRRIVWQQAEEAHVGLDFHCAPEVPSLWGDARLIRQILLNLLSNAIKFTPPGGQVTLRAAVAADGGFAFVVVDTGIGMSEEQLATALSPFGQVESAFKRKHEGTGLGLPLAASFAKLHHGSLEIDSRIDEGTTVTVHIPAQRVCNPPSSAIATGTTAAR